jgi:hypothetical protein
VKSYREKAKIIAEILYHGPTEKKTTWKWPFVQNVISTTDNVTLRLVGNPAPNRMKKNEETDFYKYTV